MKVTLLLSSAAALIVLGTIVTVSVVFTKPDPQIVQPLVVVPPVFNATRCKDLVCGGHGACIEPTGPLEEVEEYFCICDRWYFGKNCNESCPGMCSGKGDCVLSVNTSAASPTYRLHKEQATIVSSNQTNSTPDVLSCVCEEPGIGGADCGTTCPHLCSQHGNCTVFGTCNCQDGYLGDGCQYECPAHNCSGNGACELNYVNDTYAVPTCACDPDWWGADCSLPRVDCSDMYVFVKHTPMLVTGDSRGCFWDTTQVSYQFTVPTDSGHAGIRDFSSVNVYLTTPSRGDLWLSSSPLIDVVFTLTNGDPKYSTWSFVIDSYFCGLKNCDVCNNVTGICSCPYTGKACYCLDDNSINYCGTAVGPPQHPNDPETPDGAPPTPSEDSSPLPVTPVAPTRPARSDISTIFSSSWKPEVPIPNKFPALFRASAAGSPLAQNEAAIVFLAIVYGLYVIGVLIILLRKKFGKQTGPVMENPGNVPDNVDKVALRIGLTIPQHLSGWREFVHLFTRRHIVLGIFYAGPHDPFPKLARLTFLLVHLLTSLTVSAVWFGRRENAGEFITAGVLAGLVLSPFNELLHLLLRQANRLRLEAFVAYAVCGVVAAWCSYTCVLFSANFGPSRSSSWLISFLISVVFQATVFHLFATLVMMTILAIVRQRTSPHKGDAVELSALPGGQN